MIDVLSFQILNQEFALEVDYIQSVSNLLEITPVPKSKSFVEGVINLRGRIVPVIDLTKKLNMKKEENHNYENILILKIEEEEIGIFVDDVKNVLPIDENKMENFQSNDESYAGKVKGVIKVDNRLIVFLDILEILNFEKENIK